MEEKRGYEKPEILKKEIKDFIKTSDETNSVSGGGAFETPRVYTGFN